MMYLRSTLFLLLAGISLTGWGGLVFPRSGSWTRRFGAGTLLTFFIVSAAGWAGLLSGGVTWAVLLAGTLLCLLPGDARIPRGAVWIGLAGLLVLPLAILPPISRDAMSHHLLLPRIWLADGIITRPEWSRFFTYPYLVETLYSVCGGTFGFDSSRMVSLLGFLAACAVPVEYYLRKGSRKTAVLRF